MKTTTVFETAAGVFAFITALALQGQKETTERELPKHAIAVLQSAADSDVKGHVILTQRDDTVLIRGKVHNLSPGKHGFHIHQYGDLRDPKFTSAGDHYNPENKPHGGPGDPQHHVGDLGNIVAGSDGTAEIDMEADWLKVHFVVGRSLVVHAGEDDLKTQPSGDSGARVAAGVIGVANPQVSSPGLVGSR